MEGGARAADAPPLDPPLTSSTRKRNISSEEVAEATLGPSGQKRARLSPTAYLAAYTAYLAEATPSTSKE